MCGFSETGYSYFGARYYDSDLSGLFLSVDPMADKYPSISPLIATHKSALRAPLELVPYCAWNPVKLIDPDGNLPVETVLDVGLLLYDVGAAVVNHIQGNHESAVVHWINAGADVVAVAIPYAPATATRTVAMSVRQGVKQGVKESAKAGSKKVSVTGRRNITKTYSTRKQALEARPEHAPVKSGQKRVTNQTRNKSGEGNKFKTDGRKQTPHVHDKNHANKNKDNVHYRIKSSE